MALTPTKEATNFARVSRLLVDGGASILRGVFDGLIHPPVTLQSFLVANYPTLKKLKDRSILNPTQWLLLFPPPPALADSSKFDITLLALLLRNFCGLHPPTKGWNELPPATDLAVEDDICRIKCYRNTMGHASRALLTDVEFTDMWTNIRDAFVRLGGNAAEIDEFKNAYIDRDAERCIETLRQWCLHEKSVEKVEELCQGVEDVKGTVENVQGTVENVQGTVENVQGTVENVQGTVENVQGTVENVQGTVENVQGTVENVKGTVEEMKGTLKEVQDQLQELSVKTASTPNMQSKG